MGPLPDRSESTGARRGHEVGFYSDDTSLLDRLTGFIGTALSAGNAAVVVATESHLLLRLQASGVDISAAIEEGRNIALDADEALAKFIVNGLPDASETPLGYPSRAMDMEYNVGAT